MIMLLNMLSTIIYYVISTVIMLGVNVIKFILNVITAGMNENIAIALVSVEAGLMILYFTFLPMIIDNKNNEYYLGYKKSDWLIYKNFNKKRNDISFNWKLNVILIILEIMLTKCEAYSIVFILFIVFMVLISKKVIDYTKFITDKNIYDSEIEEYFLNNVKDNKKDIADGIKKHCLKESDSFEKTVKFLLNNLNNKDVKYIFEEIYYLESESSDQRNIFTIYELISTTIENYDKNTVLNFMVRDYDWYKFIKKNITEKNEEVLYRMFLNIYINNLKLYDMNFKPSNNSDTYIRFIVNTQKAIDDANISNQTKEKWFNSILNRLYSRIRNRGNKIDSLIYKDNLEFMKYIIDSKDEHRLNKLYEIFENMHNFREDLIPLVIGIYVYLIYLTDFETDSYISDEERKYYKDVFDKINKYMNFKDIRIYKSLKTPDIINIFNILSNSYINWERMKLYVVKNLTIDTAYEVLYKVFIIYSKLKFFDNLEHTITDKELEPFKYKIKNGKFDSYTEQFILSIAQKLNIPISKDILNKYAENLTKYATKKYKDEPLINDIKYNEQVDKIKELEKSSNVVLKNLEIFKNNNIKTVSKVKSTFDKIIVNNLIEDVIQDEINNPDNIRNIIEYRIYKMFEKKIKNKVDYNYDGKELLYALEQYSNDNYIYLTDEDDHYSKEYMLGKEYINITNKYNVVHTSIYNERIILNKLEIKFNKLDIKLLKLTDEQVEQQLNRFKIEENKYIYTSAKYGFDIEFTKEEMKDYIKKNFSNIKLEYYIELGDYSELDGCMLEYNFNN